MRSVYELSEKYNRDVILGTTPVCNYSTSLGSTSLLKPVEFVQSLGKLKKDLLENVGVELP
jgi:hypothetical protein